jgi:acetylglutamate kinase
METAIQKASALIEALPYIHAFRDRVVVIKYGGSTFGDEQPDTTILRDVVFMAAVGMRPIIVHGGGKHISKRLAGAGIETQFVQGLRVTDGEAIKIVEDVLVNDVNAGIVATVREIGGRATGLSGKTGRMIRVRKLQGQDAHGVALDWGYVGQVTRVNPRPLFDELLAERIPVVAPLGVDEDGAVYNINADTVASEIASSLTAEKLVYLTDVPGILQEPTDEGSLISTICAADVPRLIAEGVIAGGMLPKVEACLNALRNQVHKTHIVSGRIEHGLLLEIFTDEGVGTQIVA